MLDHDAFLAPPLFSSVSPLRGPAEEPIRRELGPSAEFRFAHGLEETRRAVRYDHELLKIEMVRGVAPAIDDVQLRDRK